MGADFRQGIMVLRDWAFLRQRYFGHPHIDYRVTLATDRLGLRTVGILVLNCPGDDCELVDLIGPVAQFPRLVAGARDLARRAGCRRLQAWIASGYGSLLSDTGAEVSQTEVRVPTSCWAPGPAAEQIRDRWWLTFGDTDFH
jgi:hypothetical protein